VRPSERPTSTRIASPWPIIARIRRGERAATPISRQLQPSNRRDPFKKIAGQNAQPWIEDP
jgi:hypothetical protein